MIKTIIFDLGGILVPECGELIRSKIADNLGISLKEFNNLLALYRDDLAKGKIKLIDAYSKIIKRIKKDINPKDILNLHLYLYEKTSTQRDKKVISLINDLKSDYNVSCLTNTEEEIAEYNRKHGLFNYFDNAFLSTEMGLKKPDKEIYTKVLEILDINPYEAIFIDDKLDYVKKARKVGISSILFENISQLKKDLLNFGALPKHTKNSFLQ